jgi:hypothetical protein
MRELMCLVLLDDTQLVQAGQVGPWPGITHARERRRTAGGSPASRNIGTTVIGEHDHGPGVRLR